MHLYKKKEFDKYKYWFTFNDIDWGLTCSPKEEQEAIRACIQLHICLDLFGTSRIVYSDDNGKLIPRFDVSEKEWKRYKYDKDYPLEITEI